EKTINVLNRIKTEIAFEFTIVGDGLERKRLEQLAIDSNLVDKVNFTGSISRNETFGLMKNSDIFIMLSKKETLGLVYLEAMAAGCIVIGTRGQGIDGIVIDGENGFLTSSSDEEEIYQTIRYVMTLSGKEQKRIRKNAKDTVNSFSDRAVSKKYYSNICAVMQGNAVDE
ncbi:glycosyl transferase group 1, partial [Priestia megaterium]